MIFDRPGELSQVLNTVAANNGSILTINGDSLAGNGRCQLVHRNQGYDRSCR